MLNNNIIVVDYNNCSIRLDRYLFKYLNKYSRNFIQQLIINKKILVNNKYVKSSYIVKNNDSIQLNINCNVINDNKIYSSNIPINIVYEDEDIIIVDKKAGMVIHPGNGNWNHTLLNAVMHHLSINTMDINYHNTYNINDNKICLIHRLDKYTSGLVILAKNIRSANILSNQFYNRSIIRNYIALVIGDISIDKGYITGYMGKYNHKMILYKSNINNKLKWSKTHFSVKKRFGFVTLLQCKLLTGRTHQIRVHMEYINNPILGDQLYGNNNHNNIHINNLLRGYDRHMLHAKDIGFIHPIKKSFMYFTSSLPKDFNNIIIECNNIL